MKIQVIFLILIVVTAIIPSAFVTLDQTFGQSSNSVSNTEDLSANSASDIDQSIVELDMSNGTSSGFSPQNSGFCSVDEEGLHCSVSENQSVSENNIILDKNVQPNFTSISTAFRINQTNETASNNVAVIYSLIDQPVDKYAGINIINNSVYAIFYNVNNGNVTNYPQWPGQLTDLRWTPGALFNMSLLREDNTISLVLNDTTYYTQLVDEKVNERGHVGLYFDVIQSLDIIDFRKEPFISPIVTEDSETVLLNGYDLPESDYILLYDSTPYEIRNGHVASKLPCDDNGLSSSIILIGKAPVLRPMNMELVNALSTPGELCFYHGDLKSPGTNMITDIALQSNSTEDIEFPETSSVTISIGEIAKSS
jgi:hypothetical protein